MHRLPVDVVELARLRVAVRRRLGSRSSVTSDAAVDRIIEGLGPEAREAMLREEVDGVRLVMRNGVLVPDWVL